MPRRIPGGLLQRHLKERASIHHCTPVRVRNEKARPEEGSEAASGNEKHLEPAKGVSGSYIGSVKDGRFVPSVQVEPRPY